MSDQVFPVTVSSDLDLKRLGVCRVEIPSAIDLNRWAAELSQVVPINMAGEGDNEYAFYRNILDEPDFPFDLILSSKIGDAISRHFLVGLTPASEEVRLDDAFCVHYDESQADSSGAKHTDPSDITVNLCLRSENVQGSQVKFYGTQKLHEVGGHGTNSGIPESSDEFLVEQIPGFATIHWGHHPHETMVLTRGVRTNIVLTYCYKDETKTDVGMRSCYF